MIREITTGKLHGASSDVLCAAVLSRLDSYDAANTGFSQTLAEDIEYLPFGPITSLTYGNGLSLNRSYGTDYLLAQQELVDEVGTPIQSLSYSYNGHGEIDGITDHLDASQSQSFVYDQLGRIEQESRNNEVTDFDYDAIGNRLGFVILNQDTLETTTQTLDYAFGSSTLMVKDGNNIIHDAAGNQVQEMNGAIEAEGWSYNARNRMQSYRKDGSVAASYLYNGLGQRVQKIRADQSVALIFFSHGC